jgi:hypothetical protein
MRRVKLDATHDLACNQTIALDYNARSSVSLLAVDAYTWRPSLKAPTSPTHPESQTGLLHRVLIHQPPDVAPRPRVSSPRAGRQAIRGGRSCRLSVIGMPRLHLASPLREVETGSGRTANVRDVPGTSSEIRDPGEVGRSADLVGRKFHASPTPVPRSARRKVRLFTSRERSRRCRRTPQLIDTAGDSPPRSSLHQRRDQPRDERRKMVSGEAEGGSERADVKQSGMN